MKYILFLLIVIESEENTVFCICWFRYILFRFIFKFRQKNVGITIFSRQIWCTYLNFPTNISVTDIREWDFCLVEIVERDCSTFWVHFWFPYFRFSFCCSTFYLDIKGNPSACRIFQSPYCQFQFSIPQKQNHAVRIYPPSTINLCWTLDDSLKISIHWIVYHSKINVPL